jgi:hypothetical protein
MDTILQHVMILTLWQTYEQAAADATPPYWETTILAPGTYGDEVFVEGLPVGSLFSFIWNAMISMSFQPRTAHVQVSVSRWSSLASAFVRPF